MPALRHVDDAVAAAPGGPLPHAVAAVALLYASVGSGLWVYSVATFDDAGAADVAQALLMCAWSALPLVLVLRGAAPRPVGLVVFATALLQFALALGSWGLELAYLPVALAGLLLLPFGRSTRGVTRKEVPLPHPRHRR